METNSKTFVKDILVSIGARKGMKLYTKDYGVCKFQKIGVTGIFLCHPSSSGEGGTFFYVNFDGKVTEDGEQMLFPSKGMQDWAKLTWKKGDVLLAGVDNLCIFMKWASNDYTRFYGKFNTIDDFQCNPMEHDTKDWSKEEDENVIKDYISHIEEMHGKKLNMETLFLENKDTNQNFKDGDIIAIEHDKEKCDISVVILDRKIHNITAHYHAGLVDGMLLFDEFVGHEDCEVRLADENEKKKLFDAMARNGLRWNPTTKNVEKMREKCDLKPFQKVLVRGIGNWTADFFSHYDEEQDLDAPFVCVSSCWENCIPYEGNENLLGTRGKPQEEGAAS